MLNRAVLIVRSKQPFPAWAAQRDKSRLVPDVKGEQTVYLVPNSTMTTRHSKLSNGYLPRNSSTSFMVGTAMMPRGRRLEQI